MEIIKGFVTIESLVDNTPGNVAILGQLSSWSRTYSREKGEYQNSDVPGYQLTSFKSVDTTANTPVVVDDTQAKEILSIVRECYSYATSHIRPYNSLDFKNEILVAFFQRIANFDFGNFIDNGALALPEWISWTSTEYGNNQIKVWLSDESFKSQYDEYTIQVIPPLDDLNHFFFAYGLVLQELQSETLPMFMDKIQTTKSVHPETYTRILTFDFFNTLNVAQKYTTNWGVLIYGQQGDNIDSIKDAITEYILANSTHTRAEWETILPDLFKRTEFVILPRWDKIAVPNQTSLSSLYQSMQDPNECVTFAKNAVSFYDSAFIQNNLTVFPYDYKELMLLAINGDTNIAEAATLVGLFPDYIPEPSTSIDFSRMTINTQNWVLFLQQLLMVAEITTIYTTVPNYMRKLTRDGNVYITAIYNNINYLVAARSNVAIYPNVS